MSFRTCPPGQRETLSKRRKVTPPASPGQRVVGARDRANQFGEAARVAPLNNVHPALPKTPDIGDSAAGTGLSRRMLDARPRPRELPPVSETKRPHWAWGS